VASVKRNIAANFAGKGVNALLSLALVPVYIRALGVESYGLVTFFIALQGLVSFADFGLGTVLSRSLAQSAATGFSDGARIRSLARTLELTYWAIGAAIGLAVVAVAPSLAGNWIKAEGISAGTVADAVALMGLAISLQWAMNFYIAGIAGLQRQVLMNLLLAGSGILRWVGTAAVLLYASPTITAFFYWQLFAGGVSTLACAAALWSLLPGRRRDGAFSWRLLKDSWQYTLGLGVISIAGLLLSQLDKIVLSKLLPIQQLAYYGLAGTLAAIPYLLVSPLATAAFPRLVELIATKTSLAHSYQKFCQLAAILLIPPAAILGVFAKPVLAAWTRDTALAEKAAPLLALLIVANTLNALAYMPYQLQLAFGRVRYALITNLIAIVAFVPALVFAIDRYQAAGAAAMALILNVIIILGPVGLAHRILVPGESGRWYLHGIALPAVAGVATASALSQALSPWLSRGYDVLAVGTAYCVCFAAVAFATPFGRDTVRQWFARIR
jgi:O-antigen/teichoic acid export membrane protein